MKFRLFILVRLITFYWWCETVLETLPSKKTGTTSHIFFEPFSATAFFISLAVSAASFGAQLLITTLLAPKPKPIVRGKLTGEVTVTDSIFGAEKIRVHGARPSDNEYGGVELGANIIWLPEVRKIETTTTTGGGGGKGGPRSTPTTTITYKCDLAAAFGEGEQRLLRLKFNDDVVYNLGGIGTPNTPDPTRFEAESVANNLTGTAVVTADTDCSNNKKVTGIGFTGKLLINGISIYNSLTPEPPDPEPLVPFYKFKIFYKSTGDTQAYVKLNGAGGVFMFPDTAGTVGQRFVMREADLGTSTLEFSNPGGAGPEIDCVDVTLVYISTQTAIGARDDSFPPEIAQDNILLPSPTDFDTNPFERFNFNAVPGVDGVLEFTLPGGAQAAWYPGTETQPVDPIIAAQVDAQFGSGFTPAFRGTPYLRVKDLDISKYGAVPQIRAVVESVHTKTVEEICLFESVRCGLTEADVDFSAGAALNIRGVHATTAEAFFEACALRYNLSFVEGADGKITIKNLADRTIKAVITKKDLGAFVVGEDPNAPQDDLLSTIEDVTELVRSFELQYYNPMLPTDYATDRAGFTFPYTDSTRSESKSVNLTLLPEEAELITRRELQKHHLKQIAPSAFTLPYKFCFLDAGDCISVEVLDNEFKPMRLEQKTGSAPGVYDCTAFSEDVVILADNPGAGTTGRRIETPVVLPANSIGTIIDIPALVDAQERKSGVYVAACRKPGYGRWQGAGVYREKAGETALMATLERQCSMGKAVNALGVIPDPEEAGFFDESNFIIVDFYNDFEPSTVSALHAEEGANCFVVGQEVLVIQTWTRDNDYPNRWIGSDLYRALKNTIGKDTTHIAGERIVFLNDAVKFVALDAAERDTERTWKFVTAGQEITDAAPISFAWAGENIYNRATGACLIGQVMDAETFQIRIGVRDYTSDAVYRKFIVSENADMSDAVEKIVSEDEFPHSVLPADFLLTRPVGKTLNETFYVQVTHSSNGWDFGTESNILAVTFADGDGLGGSTGDFSPYQDYAVEVEVL